MSNVKPVTEETKSAKKSKIDQTSSSINPQFLYASDYTGGGGDVGSALSGPQFEIYVEKADFKFNCAHFVAFKGFRERLHGHNYHASVKVVGDRSGILHEDGYLIDFGEIKKTLRIICKELNEYFICPTRSDVMTITEEGTQVCLVCEDGTSYSFPREDCAMLPIHHSTAEELAHYIYCRILE